MLQNKNTDANRIMIASWPAAVGEKNFLTSFLGAIELILQDSVFSRTCSVTFKFDLIAALELNHKIKQCAEIMAV